MLATQGSAEARIKGVEVYLGGGALATFVGRGGGGAAIFVAGPGGGDFTLKAGDRAFGHDGVVDTYRVTTTIPDHLVGRARMTRSIISEATGSTSAISKARI